MNTIERTKKFLRVTGMRQVQVAEAIGVHPVTLSRYLSAKSKRESMPEKLENFLEAAGFDEASFDENGVPHA